MVIAIAIAIIALCSALSFGLGRWIAVRRHYRTGKGIFLLVSLAPTLAVSLGIIAWHLIDQIGMTAEERASYMGPALLFIYGAPLFAGNLFCNVLAAIAGLNRVGAQ